ncbi:DUF4942 domain-containing protein [Roseobacter sp. HKCCA0434]|uniref:DUF4942 domain-containing protein n=1 Tax=Roseobacter sp. HKCCA0434 TaxID=3079297 RepID=UPI002905DA01|nr:DUF4942 domain-containing protein [Roseobacter sp. HKCCA0434]
MKDANDIPRIGEGGDETAALPAHRLSLPEIIADYITKAEAIPQRIAEFEAAMQQLNSGTSIGGAYGGSVFRSEPSLYERDLQATLLKSAWRHVHDGLRIGDVATAKDRKRIALMLENPPPFTLTDIRDQFGDYLLDPRLHKLRGLAEVFCDLDPAYRSHSKVKIGVEGLPKRIIIGHCADSWNSWGRERLKDTINALRTYRGEPQIEYAEFEAMMREARRCGESDFGGGILKLFKNGNAHLHFDGAARLDINRALAEFYGDVLPDAPSETEAKRPSTEVARDLQFYPTPSAVIDTVLHQLHFTDGARVLEPSCGDGRILDALADWHNQGNQYKRRQALQIFGIEYDAGRADLARRKGHSVLIGNFLEQPAQPSFDFVVMNPPFYGRHYKKHLDHAREFLRPGGTLACILPASAHYDHGNSIGTWHDLPVGSFCESGTGVPTGFCIWRKPG